MQCNANFWRKTKQESSCKTRTRANILNIYHEINSFVIRGNVWLRRFSELTKVDISC